MEWLVCEIHIKTLFTFTQVLLLGFIQVWLIAEPSYCISKRKCLCIANICLMYFFLWRQKTYSRLHQNIFIFRALVPLAPCIITTSTATRQGHYDICQKRNNVAIEKFPCMMVNVGENGAPPYSTTQSLIKACCYPQNYALTAKMVTGSKI